MPESKAKEVAQLFGLELEEEFLIKIKDSLHKYKFTEDGLMYFLDWGNEWIPGDPNKLIAGKCTIIKHKSILTETEKEYLSNIIKPFRDRITVIKKCRFDYSQDEYISMSVKYYSGTGGETIKLPIFKEGTMYKGMELYKDYTLEELGL